MKGARALAAGVLLALLAGGAGAQTQPADFSFFFKDLIRHRIENDLDIWLIELLLIAL